MLDFLYSGDYNIGNKDSDITPLKLHAQMHALGDKYLIEPLMNLARTKYGAIVVNDELSVSDFLSSVPEIYALPSSSKGIRELAVDRARIISSKKETWDGIRNIILQIPDFGADVVESYAASQLEGNCSICGNPKAESLQARCCKCRKGSKHNF